MTRLLCPFFYRAFLVITCALCSLLFHAPLLAKTIGLIGGNIDDPLVSKILPYAALVTDDKALQNLTLLRQNGGINSVAINYSGNGIVAGYTGAIDFTTYYAAYIANGIVIPVTLPPPAPNNQTNLFSCAINNDGYCLIGGFCDRGGGPPVNQIKIYAAAVAKDGTPTPLPLEDLIGRVQAITINEQGLGVIGGYTRTSLIPYIPYAAFVSGTTVVHPINTSLTAGNIYDVKINGSGTALIGGYSSDLPDTIPYAAFVTSPTSVHSLDLSSLSPCNAIRTISLNDSGDGLVGGAVLDAQGTPDLTQPMFAAHISQNTVTRIPSLPTGCIDSVAMNASGEALLGGVVPSTGMYPYCYLARLQIKDLTVKTLLDSTTAQKLGGINSVAMNNEGIGLVGGNDLDADRPYAALVGADGTLWPLTIDTQDYSDIRSVALNSPRSAILDNVVPKSIGPYASLIYSQLTAQQALSSHCMRCGWSTTPEQAAPDLSLVVNVSTPTCTTKPAPPFTVWATPFGSYIRISHALTVPTYTNTIGGALAGFDYRSDNVLLGGAVGYAFNSTCYKDGSGHGNVQEELLSFYSTYQTGSLSINGVLWGGICQIHNKRHTLGFITSSLCTTGGILSPHFELAYRLNRPSCRAEPFISCDWSNAWQSKATEQDAPGLNLSLNSYWTSLLQSTAGLRLYGTLHCNWGRCLLTQTTSYINQIPFNTSKQQVAFIGAASTFPITVLNQQIQNIASAQLSFSFLPNKHRYPDCTFTAEGQLGSSYQAYFGSIECSRAF